MECLKCHTPLPDNSKFCFACGADQTGGGAATTSAELAGLQVRLQRVVEGKYKIERMVGKGGMGAVFLAHDLTLDREVAIKVLPPDISQDPKVIQRFQQEAKTAAKLDHVIFSEDVQLGDVTDTFAQIAVVSRWPGVVGSPLLAVAVDDQFVYATDIVPSCGHLFAEPYASHGRILLGDSVELLKKFPERVDFFLHDSDHRPEYEWAEFVAIEPRLHPGSIVMSDNSQQTSKMFEFAQRLGKSFLYFQDQPKGHWWPGDGIGAAFVPGVRTFFPEVK